MMMWAFWALLMLQAGVGRAIEFNFFSEEELNEWAVAPPSIWDYEVLWSYGACGDPNGGFCTLNMYLDNPSHSADLWIYRNDWAVPVEGEYQMKARFCPTGEDAQFILTNLIDGGDHVLSLTDGVPDTGNGDLFIAERTVQLQPGQSTIMLRVTSQGSTSGSFSITVDYLGVELVDAVPIEGLSLSAVKSRY